MKKVLFLFATLAVAGILSACHDDEDTHTPITSTTTTTEQSTRVAPASSSSTVVRSTSY